MIGVVVAALMLLVLVYVVKLTSVPGRDDRMMRLMVGAYVLRLVIQLFTRDLAFFSHAAGGDWYLYELRAVDINRIWSFSGLEYVTADTFPELGNTTLPPNLFALIISFNGGDPSPLGCTAVVACVSCLACLNLYLLCIELGSDPDKSYVLTALFLFSPAYLLYTSDMYKDGLVIFAASTALGSSLRLARGFSIKHVILGGLALWALWYIRYYLVFVTTAPLFVGLTGVRSRSSVRPLLAALTLAASFVLLASTTDVFESVSEQATATFRRGTDRAVLDSNANAGSGVTFDDGGSPLGAIGPKLIYEVFAPFPWAGGSVGFHIGKIDTIFWYYVMYRAWRAVRMLWKEERTAVLMLLTFIVPTTFMYATSFANVGLSLRQRLIIVFVTTVLASRSWPNRAKVVDQADRGTPAPVPPRHFALPGAVNRV